jgi:hypothetical protein
MRSIEDYERDYNNLKDRQKANAQRGRLLDRLIREKMQSVIFKIDKILSKAHSEDWFGAVR